MFGLFRGRSRNSSNVQTPDRRERANTFDVAWQSGTLASSPAILEGPLSYRGRSGYEAGTAALRGGFLTHQSAAGGKPKGLRVSELSVVMDVSDANRLAFCVATGTAVIEEFAVDTSDALAYWLVGLQRYILELGGGSEDEGEEDDEADEEAEAEAEAEAGPSTPGPPVVAAYPQRSAAAPTPAPRDGLQGVLWLFTEPAGWQLGTCMFMDGELSHYPHEAGRAPTTVRLSELSLVEGVTPTRFVVATGSAYVHEFEAESEGDAQYWVGGLRACAGQAEAVTVHGYAADAVLTRLAEASSEELDGEGSAGAGAEQDAAAAADAPAADATWTSADKFDESFLREGPNAIRASIADLGATLTRTRTLTNEL